MVAMGVVLLVVVRVGGGVCIPFVVMVVMVMGVEVRVLSFLRRGLGFEKSSSLSWPRFAESID